MIAWEAVGRVRDIKPNAPPESVYGHLNKRIRNVIDTRSWSDLLRIGTIYIPQAYSTGTVTLTPGSAMVTGVATAWPTNDAVNTSISSDIIDTGVVEIFPSSFTNIRQGSFLLLEQENPAVTEVVLVLEVQADRFLASVRYQHSTGATLIASSLANLQLSAPYPVYTIKSVRSATSLELDAVFGGPTFSNVSYLIYLAYATISPYIRRLYSAWDPIQGTPLYVNETVDFANYNDPQRSATGDPQKLLSTIPAYGGLMQWEIWPKQLSPRTLSVVYYDGWPKLSQPNDFLPPFINPEIVIAGATADALRTRVIANYGKTDPYFDLTLASTYEQEYKELIENGTQADDGRFMKSLQSYGDLLGTSATYLQNHLGPPSGNWPSQFG